MKQLQKSLIPAPPILSSDKGVMGVYHSRRGGSAEGGGGLEDFKHPIIEGHVGGANHSLARVVRATRR